MTEAEFNRLAARATTAFPWCSKPLPTSTRRCRSTSSSPTSRTPICWNRWWAASVSGVIRSSAWRRRRASRCAAISAREFSRQPRLPDGAPLTIRWHYVEKYLARFKVATVETPRLPRFCGGLVGYFGYDTVRYVEKKLAHTQKPDQLGTPDILLLLSEEIAIVDNLSGKLFLVVYADPASPDAYARARARLAELLEKLREPVAIPAG